MINWLNVQNFAVVKKAELTFDSGLTVITGETGAGKSVLIGALAVLLGQRASTELIRHDANKCEIQASFNIDKSSDAIKWLSDMELINDDNECNIRRILHKEKASRAFINGIPVTIQSLKEIGSILVDIHGQNEHQRLLKKEMQRKLLDNFAGIEDSLILLADYSARISKINSNLSRLNSQLSEFEKHKSFLQFQVDELTKLAWEPNELETLTDQHTRLSHSQELSDGIGALLYTLDSSDDSITHAISKAQNKLYDLSAFDPNLSPLASQIDNIQMQLTDLINEITQCNNKYELDPSELDRLDKRLSSLHDAGRKYNVKPEMLGDTFLQLKNELTELESGDRNPEEMTKNLKATCELYDNLAEKISKLRVRAAHKLSKKINDQLPSLGFDTSLFNISLNKENDNRRGAFGKENVQFELCSSHNSNMLPIERAASGGELSRISLAIQLAVAEGASAPACVYDEVDVGIGGRVAEIVGNKLRSLAEKQQVICITHLPQVAAQGHNHICVVRSDQNDDYVELNQIDSLNREEELARMLGGVQITAKIRAHAKELLSKNN